MLAHRRVGWFSLVLVACALCATPRAARAFCGFYVGGATTDLYNNATQVVLMRQGTTTVLSMQNNYQGPPKDFALVVPVPVVVREEQVKTLPREVFDTVDRLGAPRLVEYWEQDPCDPAAEEYELAMAEARGGGEEVLAIEGSSDEDYHVTIEAQFSVGEYDIVVLSAGESTGLERWLRDHSYRIPAGAAPLLRPYIESGTKFFVAKVDPQKVKFANGMATLSPLRFHYDSPDLTLPIRLGLASSSGTQDLIVNILAPERYEVANYPNTTIPTNLVVRDSVRTRFAEFYAALFDETLRRVPGAVVTEYSWGSGSCDPCPGPVLSPEDLATLGTDVIDATYRDASMAYTLTRLHARYGKDTSQDLVFRAVQPLIGGRGTPGADGTLAMEVQPSSYNNFQARYAILHAWTGAMTCDAPTRGRWGGPPEQLLADPSLAGAGGVQPATNLAFAPRGKLSLAEHVAVDVKTLGVLASEPATLPPLQRKPRTCGCSSAGGSASAALLCGLLVVGLRRRRKATS